MESLNDSGTSDGSGQGFLKDLFLSLISKYDTMLHPISTYQYVGVGRSNITCMLWCYVVLCLNCILDQMTEHYWAPQVSSVSNEDSNTHSFQRTISAQVCIVVNV